MESLIYLDYNATTPIIEEVAEAMIPFLNTYFGNPSSSHRYGVQTKMAVENARKQLAQLLNCEAEEIVFTSGGSEANNYAIKGYAFANQHLGNHIITSSVEHPAVLEVCRFLQTKGFEITYLPVDLQGCITITDFKKSIRPTTILASIMHANNEVGVIQPIAEIASICKEFGIVLHSDGAQSVGKIDTDVKQMGVDLLSVAAHKFYGPKGIGALFVKNGVKLEKLIHGADHERNLRAGTENILEIVGMGKAAEIALRDRQKNFQHAQNLRDRLESKLLQSIPNIQINGAQALRLPNTCSVSISRVEANTLLDELEGIAASAGAACHTDSVDVSAVLQAMFVPIDFAMGTIRFSVGRYNTEQEIDAAVAEVVKKVQQLRGDIESTVLSDLQSGEIKLTHFTHGLGCACKLRPQDLEQVLQKLPKVNDAKVLVGTDTSDDASVYWLNSEMALVQTLDFFTPIVDSPYHFGAIAAANALSDIYAMGAHPIFALNIVGFPDKRLPLSVLQEILEGAQDKAKEAGISILGGHSVEDSEPKYGMVVSGLVHPDRILRNVGARHGDGLILTKPIGTGIISTAIKRGVAEPSTADYVTKLMSTLNKTAAETMLQYEVHACTDVTGFGLLGHLREMIQHTAFGVDLEFTSIPIIPEARDFAVAGIIPGGTKNNLEWVAKDLIWGKQRSDSDKYLLADAQTSGGLLIAVSAEHELALLQALIDKKVEAALIGRFTNQHLGKISVL
jgi:cysteine desulfurase NifS/selenium donor protein